MNTCNETIVVCEARSTESIVHVAVAIGNVESVAKYLIKS